jgi:phosphatidylglycerol---prolipoprotein diacylglyceryl transferase
MIQSQQTAQLVHLLFEWLALAGGFQFYRLLKKKNNQGSILQTANFAVAIGAILGAAIGNKLVYWIEVPHLFAAHAIEPAAWFMGQSMVGGLLGGLIGVEVAKHRANISVSTGDLFVFPILLGLIVGRIGCFLAGLYDGTFGIETSLPWGIDFGDGVMRHPTQLYEIIYAALMWLVLAMLQPRLISESGLLFKFLLVSYLVWRVLVDFLKPVPYEYPFGLSGIQWVCIVALAIYAPITLGQLQQRTRKQWSHISERQKHVA